MRRLKEIIVGSILACAIVPQSAAQDTVRKAIMLPEVQIIQLNTHPEGTLTQTPTQVATAEKIERLGDAQLSGDHFATIALALLTVSEALMKSASAMSSVVTGSDRCCRI